MRSIVSVQYNDCFETEPLIQSRNQDQTYGKFHHKTLNEKKTAVKFRNEGLSQAGKHASNSQDNTIYSSGLENHTLQQKTISAYNPIA